MPDKEGFYWARLSNHMTWNLIVYVYGQAPFFRIDSIDVSKEKENYKSDINPKDIAEFGPEIVKPSI